MSEHEFQVAADTNVGLQREVNEDTYICQPDLGIFAVIDGVGGEAAGEVAAQKAKEVLLSRLRRRTAPPRQRIREAITLANNAIFEQAQSEPQLQGMACVLTVAVVEDRKIVVGHVGDTRLYRLREGGIDKVTHDHSPVGELEERGKLGEEEAMAHPRRGEILRDVGSERLDLDSPDFVELLELDLGRDEALLLCTDGLTDQVTKTQVRHLVERHARDPGEAVRRLIRAANEAGGRDNVTVVLLKGREYLDTPSEASSSRRGSTSGSGVAHAVKSRAQRLRRGIGVIFGPRARRIYGAVLVLALAAWLLANPVFRKALARWVGLGEHGNPPVLQVGGADSDYPTIGQALAAAQPGQVIQVAPGTYDEQVELRDGISLVSLEPRMAILQPLAEGSLAVPAAVVAEGVREAWLQGFRIVGDDTGSLDVGLKLVASEVVVEDVEVTGARRAGIEVSGADRSLLSYCLVHENRGAGLVLEGPVATKLRHNQILRNGTEPEAPGVGIDLRRGADPFLTANVFDGNGAAAIRGLAPSRREEVLSANEFRSVPSFLPPPPLGPAGAEETGEAGASEPTGAVKPDESSAGGG